MKYLKIYEYRKPFHESGWFIIVLDNKIVYKEGDPNIIKRINDSVLSDFFTSDDFADTLSEEEFNKFMIGKL
jgi:hypothetical protein